MNKNLQNIQDIIQNSVSLGDDAKETILQSIKSVNDEIALTEFKLDRTEKVKRTTGILLEETIEELEQKRKAVEEQAAVIHAENDRKSQELEEARQMQLAMLPKEIPQLENLEMAVYMKTATEVGGDYYDFSFSDDGFLNIAIGDATGHGMKAGIMVSSMKSIFTTNSPKMDIESFFATANRGVKSMNLKRMMMGFTMLNIQNNNFQMINAGMPPVFYYSNSSKLVKEIKEHGVPIGAMNNIEFKTIRGSLKKGDSILLLTDGMPELHNRNNEMYGYDRIRDGFQKAAEKAPEEIVTYLKNESSAWLNGQDLDDDVTFVVIKVK